MHNEALRFDMHLSTNNTKNIISPYAIATLPVCMIWCRITTDSDKRQHSNGLVCLWCMSHPAFLWSDGREREKKTTTGTVSQLQPSSAPFTGLLACAVREKFIHKKSPFMKIATSSTTSWATNHSLIKTWLFERSWGTVRAAACTVCVSLLEIACLHGDIVEHWLLNSCGQRQQDWPEFSRTGCCCTGTNTGLVFNAQGLCIKTVVWLSNILLFLFSCEESFSQWV